MISNLKTEQLLDIQLCNFPMGTQSDFVVFFIQITASSCFNSIPKISTNLAFLWWMYYSIKKILPVVLSLSHSKNGQYFKLMLCCFCGFFWNKISNNLSHQILYSFQNVIFRNEKGKKKYDAMMLAEADSSNFYYHYSISVEEFSLHKCTHF